MTKYLKYLRYLVIHKWFVFLELSKRGHFWMGIIHDLSKLRPSEFIPYANRFGVSGATDNESFNYAWFLHQKRNKHHWQWWILQFDDGKTKALEIPEKYLIEMICDWEGAGKAQKHGVPIKVWYEKNSEGMVLHHKSRKFVERELYGD